MSTRVKILIILCCVAVFSSCSAIKRTLTKDKSIPDIPASSLAELHHPQGTLEDVFYPCSCKGPSKRRMLVYLPAGYSAGNESYPVLYLLHGARGNETSWIKDGNVLYLIDSLQRCSLARKSIVVMMNMNQYDDDEDFANSRFKYVHEVLTEIDGAVESTFVHDVVGYIESHYRAIPDKNHRAIAGLSVGAFQTIYISATHPDTFGYVGLFSPFYKKLTKKSDYSEFYTSLLEKQKAQFSDPPQMYLIMIGLHDFFINHVEYFRRYLNKYGFKFQYMEVKGGGHDWNTWTMFFDKFYQKLF